MGGGGGGERGEEGGCLAEEGEGEEPYMKWGVATPPP